MSQCDETGAGVGNVGNVGNIPGTLSLTDTPSLYIHTFIRAFINSEETGKQKRDIPTVGLSHIFPQTFGHSRNEIEAVKDIPRCHRNGTAVDVLRLRGRQLQRDSDWQLQTLTQLGLNFVDIKTIPIRKRHGHSKCDYGAHHSEAWMTSESRAADSASTSTVSELVTKREKVSS